jgi:CheY-like chemotaxis protein
MVEDEIRVAARALVVEDDPGVGSAYKLILAHLGVSFDLVASGEEALARLSRARYDGAFLDVGLQGGVGVRAILDEIRRVDASLLSRTTLATGDPRSPLVRDLRAEFAVAVLGKPFGISDLDLAVRRWRGVAGSSP